MILAAFYVLTFVLWPLGDGRYSFWREDQGQRKGLKQLRSGPMQKPKSFYLFK